MTPTDPRAAALRMRHMLYGHLLSRGLCTAAELGVPELLADGPLSLTELAQRTDTDAALLGQLLRSLVAYEVFDETAPHTFALTDLGATLLPGHHASALPTALLLAGEVGAAWNALTPTVRTTEPAFDAVHGIDFFSYLRRNTEFRNVFDRSQATGLALELDELLAAIDFDRIGHVVDIGGGDGALAEAIATRYRRPRVTVMDTASVARRAAERFTGGELEGRIDCVAGDFDVSVPPGGDLYLMRHIVHDWSDDRCVAILAKCRAALGTSGRVLVLDRVAPSVTSGSDATDAERFTALMSLYMMTVVRGRERTVAEFRELFAAAGFDLQTVMPLGGDAAALLAVPA